MFTGIIEEIGKVVNISNKANSALLIISCDKVLNETNIGDSIAVNGVCLTVVEIKNNSFSADISFETLKKSSMNDIKINTNVNLERALTLNTRLGGHLVSGHVDAVGKIQYIKQISNSYLLGVSFPNEIAKYIAPKGSVTIDGISLTVSNIISNILEIAVIPHTFENTILKFKNIGSKVNIEVDILSRYIEKLLYNKDTELEKKLQELYDSEDIG